MISTFIRQNSKYRMGLFSLAALMVVLVIGWVLRAQATLSTELIPGINGAYYPVQARAILTTGTLGLPDFPLLFYLEAGIAGVFSLFAPLEEAIMATVRWTDTLFPVLLALPIFLFAHAFSRQDEESSRFTPILATLLVGLIAVGNTSLLRMAGDFHKNAAGLPLSLMFVYFLYQSLRHHRRRDYVLAGLFFVLTCLTHLGVAALTLTITTLIALISLFNLPNRKRAVKIMIGLVVILALTFAIVYIYDPVRISRILGVVLNPSELFANSPLSQFLQGQKSPGGVSIPNLNELLMGNGLGILGIIILIFKRKSLHPAERVVLWATSLTSLFFSSPLIGGQWAGRLSLMAFVPGLVPLVYLTARWKWGWAVVWPLTVMVFSASLGTVSHMKREVISVEGYEELISFKDELPEGETLIVAVHGLEWWVAWTMETDISNRFELAIENWEEYDYIYIIEENNSGTLDGNRPAQPPGGGNPPPPGTGPGSPTSRFGQMTFGIGVKSANLELAIEGQYFTLHRVTSRPILLQGSGPPDLEGTPEFISDEKITVDGATVYIDEDTVISRDGEMIALGDLDESVLVWGTWGLLGNTLTADYILAGRPQLAGPQQGNQPGGQPPPGQPTGDTPPESVKFGPLTMVTRAGWGAKPPNPNARAEGGQFDPQTNPAGVFRYPEPLRDWLNTIVVHHSALDPSQGPLEIQRLHMEQRGYTDIAYHFLIGPDGALYEGRPINVRGAHVEGFNTGTIGVVLLGNMEIIEPSTEQLATLEILIDVLRNRFGITHLAGHHDFNPDTTECPGENLHKLLPAMTEKHGLTFGTEGYIPPPWIGKP